MKVICPLLIKSRFIFWLYIVEEVIKEAYQSNSGTAYETYKEAVKKGNSTRLQDVKNYLSKRDTSEI